MPSDNLAKIFERIEQTVWILTAASSGRRGGLVATFVTRASIAPEFPRLVAGIDQRHATWELIEGSNAFAAHLVREGQSELVWRFGLESSRETDKLAGLEVLAASTGSPILADCLAWFDCRVESRMDTGDRTIYLAEIAESRINGDERPLTVNHLIQTAPAEKLAILHDQLTADAMHDREAILAWRKSGG